MDTLQWTLGDRLAKARRAAGISSQEMAEALEITRNTVGNYEHGRTIPGRAMIMAWAAITNAPIEWLLDLDPNTRGFHDLIPGYHQPPLLAVAS